MSLTSSMPIYPPSTVQMPGKNAVANSKLKKLVRYAKLLYFAMILAAITFFVSTMLINDPSFKKVIVDRLSRPGLQVIVNDLSTPEPASRSEPHVIVNGLSTPESASRSKLQVNVSDLSTPEPASRSEPHVIVNGLSTPESASRSELQVNVSGLFAPQPASSLLQANDSEAPCHVTKSHCSRGGGEALPKGLIVETSNLQLRSLGGNKVEKAMPKNLLAIAAGINQKKEVDSIVKKFPLNNFTIMLFHYDGVVDQWHDLSWSNRSIHIVALNQTKWWFSKRFMHPDIVAEYNYIFIWDEDLGVEHFHADKYLKIMEQEGFEISQPALDPASARIHHMLTRRQPSRRAHTMVMADHGTTKCNKDSNAPPCTGYVEVMAPVFSKAAWRCVWHMIQNDLVQGWGIDFKIGYCAQGDRRKKVGVIDAEYVVHKGIPSLGGPRPKNATTAAERREFRSSLRSRIRAQCARELRAFLHRWERAAEEDESWKDPYPPKNDSSSNYHTV